LDGDVTISAQEHIRWLRNTAPYINAHRGKTFVLMLGGAVAQHENFPNIIHDIALLNSLGVRLVLIHGSRLQIDQRLSRAGLDSVFHEGLRITDNAAMEHVKDAAGSLRAQIEALLSMGLPNSPMQGSRMRVCSGNFVTARPIGVVNGIDFHHTGRVRRVDASGINQQLADGSIVLLSPLGYSPTGEIFNLALEDIAVQCAAAIGADKLVLFGGPAGVLSDDGTLIRQCAAGEIDELPVADPQQASLLQSAKRACLAQVERCHIISYEDDCALLQELFTQQGALVKRSRELLETEISQFRLLVRDGRIIACAALYPFLDDRCGEIACIVSHPDYRGGKRGQRLLKTLEQEARSQGLDRVFVLTTQTAHWFVEQGFVEADQGALPSAKQSLYNLQRNSKVFVKTL
jgi:amino-acid N-acetyltransferase